MGVALKSISTHVLDVSVGKPGRDIPVILERLEPGGYLRTGSAVTDADGRVKELVRPGDLTPGTYRITFETAAYFSSRGTEAFYPEVTVVFVVRYPDEHYHVPLLLTAFGYSTYRGS